ncbi:glycerol-3-phosphate ABC transporter ATP-binding protein [Petrotoga sp. 9PW.55.5.1]|uniref:ABC transporter ATP-binding protein n=1 Tax=Petrotoga sp. 9PW.55.5.1 TaxID=1308979 RepID=UPI000DC249CA|nr:sn-glycerol-3-phosphate ABC transporter ATP-binding protein UgpC [Petrotoga sp. 9PW.55.5.1]RAO98424.1 glycerol-3-phosphate ABC transporter ATP-binding protein [Petrotoga sp. 9PW.55.5.1]
MAQVLLEKVNKVYPNGFHAVKDVEFNIEDKEFLVLLGPSGCGKTTTLRMIAGLEDITEGTIKIDTKVVNDVEPKDRDIAMVFQNYALYPHMTVYDNMAFGLKLRKTPKDEIEKKVRDASKILGIEHLLDRKPKQLSGGQRQRVALGRAIVRDPKVFLFDEPLSNLDAKLRVQMRAELKKLQKRLEATVAYVTHDQVEAMTMADKIVIMNEGYIQQVGGPFEVYNNPANIFVAGFIGTPPMNFLNVKVIRDNGIEDIYDKNLFEDAKETNTLESVVDVVEPLGSETLLHLTVGNQSITAKVSPQTTAEAGKNFKVALDMKMCHAFDKETEKAIF